MGTLKPKEQNIHTVYSPLKFTQQVSTSENANKQHHRLKYNTLKLTFTFNVCSENSTIMLL